MKIDWIEGGIWVYLPKPPAYCASLQYDNGETRVSHSANVRNVRSVWISESASRPSQTRAPIEIASSPPICPVATGNSAATTAARTHISAPPPCLSQERRSTGPTASVLQLKSHRN